MKTKTFKVRLESPFDFNAALTALKSAQKQSENSLRC